jgi:hypothetical protein
VFQKRGCALDVGVRGAFAGKIPHTTDTVYDLLCRSMQCTSHADTQDNSIQA